MNSTRDELQKRYDGLESTAMMMAAQGIQIPPDVAAEISQVRTQLDQLGGHVEIKPWTEWLGYTLEGFSIKERLSSGTYCNVFRAVNETTQENCVFKIAKSERAIQPANDYFVKQAISFDDEICAPVNISANEAIQQEHQRLQMDMSGHFVPVVSSGLSNNCFYYRMPLLEGQTLRDLIPLTDMPFLQYAIEIFDRLCKILDRLTKQHYHGNLQPDNIFITKTDIVLLSPGAYNLNSIDVPSYMICTPAYYPFFEANDLFSLGCIFWESVLKVQPLAVNNAPEKREQFAQDMLEMLDYRKSFNHQPLAQFLKLRTPKSLRNDISDKTELFLLKVLKLAYNSNGLLTGVPGFKNPSEFAAELQALARQGLLRE